ncbi:MAG: RHS repeat-associated core domain-containing protein, partial [Pyrinomonadaceae bacterium]
VYDALGNRVASKVNDVWRFSIYDAFGKLVAEYGQADEGVGGVSYIQQDWQGSVRTITNSNGFVVSRTDYTSFGEAVGAGVGLRSTAQGYWGTIATRQGYGLTERDEATGLDHTWFRKNEGSTGRWTSPDPYNGSMDIDDPQSFNRYSYVGNQPTNFVDPSGLWCTVVVTTIYDEDGTTIVSQWTDFGADCFEIGGPIFGSRGGGPTGDPGGGGGGRGPSIGPGVSRPPREPIDTTPPCLQFGVSFSATAGAGFGGTIIGTGGATFGVDRTGGSTTTFIARSGGVLAGGTAAGGSVGTPSNRGFGIGAMVDIGPSLFLSNARDPGEHQGVTDTHIIALGILNFQLGLNPGSRTQTLEIGPGAGLGYFNFQTQGARPIVANTAFSGNCGK